MRIRTVKYPFQQDQITEEIASQDHSRPSEGLHQKLFACRSQFYLRNQAICQNPLIDFNLDKIINKTSNFGSQMPKSNILSDKNSDFNKQTSIKRQLKVINSIINSSRSSKNCNSNGKTSWNEVKTNLSCASRQKINKQNSLSRIKIVKSELNSASSKDHINRTNKQRLGLYLEKENAIDLTPLKNILKLKRPELMEGDHNYLKMKPNGQHLSKLITQKTILNSKKKVRQFQEKF